MQNKKIKKLINDLESLYILSTSKTNTETNLLFWEVDPPAADKSLVPFKTIEEWTSIKKSFFPHCFQLSGDQCQEINEALLKVFTALNLTITDMPDEIHPMLLYVALISNWSYPVQYLPLSGMELSFFSEQDVERYFAEMSGIFNDDGTKVDVDSIPLPSLCVICKNHLSDDEEEHLLCRMTRNDQRDDECFECASFEKMQ